MRQREKMAFAQVWTKENPVAYQLHLKRQMEKIQVWTKENAMGMHTEKCINKKERIFIQTVFLKSGFPVVFIPRIFERFRCSVSMGRAIEIFRQTEFRLRKVLIL